MLPLAIFENLRFLPSSVSAEVLLMPSQVLLEPRGFWPLWIQCGHRTKHHSEGTGEGERAGRRGFSRVGRQGLEAAWVCLLSLVGQGSEGMRQQVVVGRPERS